MCKSTKSQHESIRAVEWKNDHLILLDQRKLPQSEQYIELYSAEDTADAIRKMVVRGASVVGIAAAYALVMAARKSYKQYPLEWLSRLVTEIDLLAKACPTISHLHWSLRLMCSVLNQAQGDPIPMLLALARRIHEEDITANYRMGELGAQLIDASHGVITHGNTGALATGGYGTALGVIRTAYAQQRIEQIYVSETRPAWQGARLAAWELVRDQITTCLICEGAVAHLLRQGNISWVIIGAYHIAANGDVANLIGTYSLAVNAHYHQVKVMVVASTSSVDLNTASGADIALEERSAEEILMVRQQRIAIQGLNAWNPAFDVTPAELVDVLVTERGVVWHPDEAKLKELMASS